MFGPPAENFDSGLALVIVLPSVIGMVALLIAIAWVATGNRRMRTAGRGALQLVALLHLMVIAYTVAVSSIGFEWSYLPWTVGISAAAAIGA